MLGVDLELALLCAAALVVALGGIVGFNSRGTRKSTAGWIVAAIALGYIVHYGWRWFISGFV